MKSIFALFSIVICALCAPMALAAPILTPAWQTETVFQQPESVVFDAKRSLLYVSNVNGNPNEADGNGYLSQLNLDGTVAKLHWIEGLNAPKGMTIVADTLYVADINELIVIDLNTSTITQRYLAPKAKFLNDVVADMAGNVYVSDMLDDTLYRLAGDEFTVWIKDSALEYPNGLLVEGDSLIVGSWGVITDGFSTDVAGHLKTVSLETKTITSLGDATPAGNLDGVEADGNGNYLVTDWMHGKLLHISPVGISNTLLSLSQGSADHTVVSQHDLVIIPMMLSGNVVAYTLIK